MSKIEVNTIDVQCGSTLTVGSSGKTVTLATGASQSGFGRTGTVDWCTTAKTSPFTATSGDGFFLNTNGGAITVTLPSSPSQGDIVAFKDYNNTWDDACKAVTLCRNGSKINGSCNNSILNTQSQSVTLIYVDGVKGWQDIHDSTANVTGAAYTSATGGTVTTSGDFKIHTFNSDANFVVSSVGNDAGGTNKVSYMVVAGGGGGAGQTGQSSAGGGGGGAGGYREGKVSNDPYSASPTACTSGCNAGLTVTAATFPITVGGGGATWSSPYTTATSRGVQGSTSTFSTISSAGGGGGGGRTPGGPAEAVPGGDGGSGGGSGGGGNVPGGTGNTPPVTPAQGTNGGTRSGAPTQGASGGGGGTAAGSGGSGACGGVGGTGATSSINATPTARAGGGSGGDAGSSQTGGTGGGGASGNFNSGTSAGGPPESNGAAGTANTGGGGGGGAGANSPYNVGGTGGSGVVIIRYKFQN